MTTFVYNKKEIQIFLLNKSFISLVNEYLYFMSGLKYVYFIRGFATHEI